MTPRGSFELFGTPFGRCLEFPGAQRTADALQLPVHAGLSADQLAQVASRVLRALSAGQGGQRRFGRRREPVSPCGSPGLRRGLRGDRDRGRGRLRGRHRARPDGAARSPGRLRRGRSRRARSATSSTSTPCGAVSPAGWIFFPGWSRRRDLIVARVRQNASAMILLCRFLPGLRVAIPAACAYADVAPLRFSVLSLLSQPRLGRRDHGRHRLARPHVLRAAGDQGLVDSARSRLSRARVRLLARSGHPDPRRYPKPGTG